MVLAGWAVGSKLIVKSISVEKFNTAPSGVYKIEGLVADLTKSEVSEGFVTCVRLRSLRSEEITNERLCSNPAANDRLSSRLNYNQKVVLKVNRGPEPKIISVLESEFSNAKQILEGELTGAVRSWNGHHEVEVRLDTPFENQRSVGWFNAAGVQRIKPNTKVRIDHNGTAWTSNPSFF